MCAYNARGSVFIRDPSPSFFNVSGVSIIIQSPLQKKFAEIILERQLMVTTFTFHYSFASKYPILKFQNNFVLLLVADESGKVAMFKFED